MNESLDRERLSDESPQNVMDVNTVGMRQSELLHKSMTTKEEREDRRILPAYELSERKAYILGYFLGDGTLGEYSMRAKSQDKDCLEYLANCFGMEFLNYPRVYRSDPAADCWGFCVGSPQIRRFLSHFSGKEKRWPYQIMVQSSEVKKEFIAGLMDTDGTACITKRGNGRSQCLVGFSSKSIWVMQFRELLSSVGVKCNRLQKVTDSRWWETCIYYQFTVNTRSFIESGCYFHIARKNASLKWYLENVRVHKSHK